LNGIFFYVGLGECTSGPGADFSNEYAMLSNSRYTVTSSTPPSGAGGGGGSGGVGVGVGVEMGGVGVPVTGDHTSHYLQTNGSVGGGVASLGSAQLFHPHAGLGHFSTPAATYIPGSA